MRTFYRILKFGIYGFWRNLALSLNATFIMTLTLITLSIFVVLNIIVTDSTKNLESRLDITVFLNENAQAEEITDFVNILKAQPETKEVVLVDKKQLLEEWNSLYKSETEFRNLITEQDNPFLREVRVKTYDPEQLTKISNFVEKDQYKLIVNDVSFRETQQKIITFMNYSKLLRKASLIISLILALISLLVIFTTIRLTIFSRREEIEIMRLVGASNILVKAPFWLEGILYGILATVLAQIIFFVAIWSLESLQDQYLKDQGIELLLTGRGQNLIELYQNVFGLIILVHLFCGVFIGIISSTLAVRKYLRV